MKSVLISIQPYWVFLIIARLMGWTIPQEKTVEVRKDYPKANDWNKRVHIYCSKNRKSFNRIPKEYQPLMEKFLGKVISEFVCDEINTLNYDTDLGVEPPQEGYFFTETPSEHVLFDFNLCLTNKELIDYGKMEPLYGWHISELKIYDAPKELGEFKSVKQIRGYHKKSEQNTGGINIERLLHSNRVCVKYFDRPPQNWGYVEEV